MLIDILFYFLVYLLCQTLTPLSFTAVVGFKLRHYFKHVMLCNVITTVMVGVYFIFGPLGVDVGVTVLLPITVGLVYGLLLAREQSMYMLSAYSLVPILLSLYMAYQQYGVVTLFKDMAFIALPIVMLLVIYTRRIHAYAGRGYGHG